MKTICYLSYGYPSIPESLKNAERYLEAGCDIIEVSLPARDPYVDPEHIAAHMADALAACDDYAEYLGQLGAFIQAHKSAKIVLLVYEHTMREAGLPAFIAFCKTHGVEGIIYAGERSKDTWRMLMDAGVPICSPVRREMPEEDILDALAADGFVYMEAKPDRPWPPEYATLAQCIAALRARGIDRPIYCGVGIRTPDDVREVKAAGGDGFFVGAALIRQYNCPERLMETIQAFKQAAL